MLFTTHEYTRLVMITSIICSKYSKRNRTKNLISTSLVKEVMFLVALVRRLSVCLFVDNITQKIMNGLGPKFMEGSWVVQGRTD